MRLRQGLLLALALTLAACRTAPLQVDVNPFGLQVVDDVDLHQSMVRRDPGQMLVPVRDLAPGVVLDVRYATESNFMNEKLYPREAAFLRCAPARALAAVQRDLETRGLGLKVFDAYRPYAVTVRMWEKWKDPDYVADPSRGSRHNRGAAVDVTLVDLRTGRELEMPTGYDDFTSAASSSYQEGSKEALKNRAILREAMERFGFVVLPSEWWHFDYRGWEAYGLLDVPHEALGTLAGRCP
jgi:D-alanyl-D-alanine dipeptidase